MKKIFIAILIILIGFVGYIYYNTNIRAKAQSKKPVHVYFVKNINSKHSKIVPVNRFPQKGENRLNVAVDELLKGPTKAEKRKGISTEIPETTKLIDIVEAHNKTIINLSADFESGGGSQTMDARVIQLTNTVIDATKGKPVYLKLDGKPVDFVGGEGVEIPKKFSEYEYDNK